MSAQIQETHTTVVLVEIEREGEEPKIRKMHVKSGAQVLSSARHTTPLPSASKPHVHAPFLYAHVLLTQNILLLSQSVSLSLPFRFC